MPLNILNILQYLQRIYGRKVLQVYIIHKVPALLSDRINPNLMPAGVRGRKAWLCSKLLFGGKGACRAPISSRPRFPTLNGNFNVASQALVPFLISYFSNRNVD